MTKKKIVAATTELSKTTCTEDNLTGSISESLWDENIFSTPCKMVDKMLSDALLLPWGEIKCLCITLNNGFLSFLLFSGTDLFLTVKKQQQQNKNNKKNGWRGSFKCVSKRSFCLVVVYLIFATGNFPVSSK